MTNNSGSIVAGEDPSLSVDGRTLYYWRWGSWMGLDLSTRAETSYGYWEEPWSGPTTNRVVYHTAAPGDVVSNTLDGANPTQLTHTGDAFFGRWSAPTPTASGSILFQTASLVSNQSVKLSWSAESGRTVRIEYAEELLFPKWEEATNFLTRSTAGVSVVKLPPQATNGVYRGVLEL